MIRISPTRRAFSILKHRNEIRAGQIKVWEFFSGAGVLASAIHNDKRFEVIGALEFEARFADAYSKKFPNTPVWHCDMRDFDPADAPTASMFVVGLPCTDHSLTGRAKQGLAGRPELGQSGDLFVPVLSAIRCQMPAAVLVEQVPGFKNSYAAEVLKASLTKIGYFVSETIIKPHDEWGEIQDRPRYCLVATLDSPFEFKSPKIQFTGSAATFLDAPDSFQDNLDADRIQNTVKTLDKHFAKHAALGHGFSYSVIDHSSTKIPTITKSYHKINNGPFVRIADGRVRMLRKHELERIFGCQISSPSFSLTTEGLGQGVLPRVFSRILSDIANHLCNPAPSFLTNTSEQTEFNLCA